MVELLRRFSNDMSGATSIEYGLIAAIIAFVIIGSLQNMGGKLSTKFGKINNALS